MTKPCVHHWDIASIPVSGSLPGQCRKCGTARAFPAVPNWGNDPRVSNRSSNGASNAQATRSKLSKLDGVESRMEAGTDDS